MRDQGFLYALSVWTMVCCSIAFPVDLFAQPTKKPTYPTPRLPAQIPNPPIDLPNADKSLLAKGHKLLLEQGCTGCHRLDLQRHLGPGLAGIWGRSRNVQSSGRRWVVRAERAYFLRALRTPNAEILEGYAPVMPAYRLAAHEEEAILAVLRDLSQSKYVQEARKKGSASLLHVILGALLFVFGHFGLSSLPVRRWLIARLGDGPFQGLYSLIAIAAMIWMSWGWSSAPYVELWGASAWARYLPLFGMPIVCVLFVLGVSTPSPTTAGQESRLSAENAVQGILKITRHPSLWSFALWGLLHIPPNGDLASVILFGSVAVLALGGMAHIDARRRATQGDAWGVFEQQTSALPFLAVFQGRTRLTRADLPFLRILLAIGIYVALLCTHTLFVGVSPFPY